MGDTMDSDLVISCSQVKLPVVDLGCVWLTCWLRRSCRYYQQHRLMLEYGRAFSEKKNDTGTLLPSTTSTHFIESGAIELVFH